MTRPRRSAGILNWKALLGFGLSLGFLYFALRDVHFGEVLRHIVQADPLYFLASVAAATAVFAVRAWRWKPLLEPVRSDVPYRPRFAATSIGFMANNLLPMRVGEFARAFALSRLQPVPITASFGSIVVERLLDGITIIGCLLVPMLLPGFPEVRTIGGQSVGVILTTVLGVLGTAAVVLTAMVIWPRPLVRFFEATAARLLPRQLRRPVVDALEAFLAGLGALREPRLLVRAGFGSIVLWMLNAFSFWLAFRAFGIPADAGFVAAVFLQALIGLAVALPSAPGFFGLFEAGARFGLVELWGVDVNQAVGFAIGFHMGGFIPITVIGLYYVWRLGLSWREVEYSEQIVEEAVEAAGPPARERP